MIVGVSVMGFLHSTKFYRIDLAKSSNLDSSSCEKWVQGFGVLVRM